MLAPQVGDRVTFSLQNTDQYKENASPRGGVYVDILFTWSQYTNKQSADLLQSVNNSV